MILVGNTMKAKIQQLISGKIVDSFLDHVITWKELPALSALEVNTMFLALAARGAIIGGNSQKEWIQACKTMWSFYREQDN